MSQGDSINLSAKKAKCSEKTIDAWLKNNDFCECLAISKTEYLKDIQATELELIRQDTHALSKNFEALSGAILALLTESLEYLDPSTIKPSEFAKITDSYLKLAEASMVWRSKAWGADRLMESLELENEN